MKKCFIVFIVFAFVVSLGCFVNQAVYAKDAPKAVEKKSEVKTAAPVAAKEDPKVVCKFKSKEDLQEFEKLYVAKQATFARMSVLQAYFSLEQNNLQEIDKQSDSKFKFKMDPSKMYDLNRETLEIKEVGDVPQQPAPEQQ